MPIKTNLKDLKPAKDRFSRKIQLLSKGYFAPNAFPDGLITVYPWDTQVGEWFASQARKQGQSANLIYDVIPKIAALGECKLDSFIASEALLVLLVSRSILHNDSVTFEAACPHCGHRQHETIQVPGQLQKQGEKPDGYPGWDEVTLTNSKDVVRLRPYTIGDMRALKTLSNDPAYKANKIPDPVLRLSQVTLTIGGGKPDSPQELLTWFQALHPGDAEQLLAYFDTMQPTLSTEVPVTCDEPACGKDFEYRLQMDIDFFRRGGPTGPNKEVAPVS